MTVNFGDAVVLTMVCLVAYQLVSGKVIGRDWRAWAQRSERPGIYWLSLVPQIVIVSVIAATVVHAHIVEMSR